MARKVKPKYMRYIAANGEFLAGVPAEDMSLERWLEIPEEIRELALALGLYQTVADEPPQESETDS